MAEIRIDKSLLPPTAGTFIIDGKTIEFRDIEYRAEAEAAEGRTDFDAPPSLLADLEANPPKSLTVIQQGSIIEVQADRRVHSWRDIVAALEAHRAHQV